MTPYNLHTDFYQKNMLNNAKIKPAYTIIIPLDDFKTSTFVFNQSDEDKELSNLDRTKVLEDCVNNETRKNYLSHIKDTELDYLSVKEQFHWTKAVYMHAIADIYIVVITTILILKMQ